MNNNTLYTIGYSGYKINTFIEILKKYSIKAVADVRSAPYSRYKQEFNREVLSKKLQSAHIGYVFLGNECGARISDPACYIQGKADFHLIAKHRIFKKGLQRLKSGIKKFNISLLCAEIDPITCHRTILVCRNLRNETEINHILPDGTIENNRDSEIRLLKMFKLSEPHLFKTREELIETAYDLQGERIAYSLKSGAEEKII